jgi:hypothetical protein
MKQVYNSLELRKYNHQGNGFQITTNICALLYNQELRGKPVQMERAGLRDMSR